MSTKWAVLGSGGIARRRTIPEGIQAAENAELVGVYDIDPGVNAAVAEEFGVTAYASEEELLGGDCGIVYIATPAYSHAEQVERAAKAGKHVLCEKPLGMTIAEGEQMLAACKQNGVKLGTGLMMRFHAQHQAALKMVKDGALGKMVYGRAQLSCWFPPMDGAWRQDPAKGGGGSLMDLGGHCIDLLEMFLGHVTKVSCMTGNLVHDYATEDTAIVALEFDSGAKGTVDNLFCVPDASSKNRLELYGALGSILAEGTIGQGEIGEMTAMLEEEGKGYEAQQQREGAAGIELKPEPVNMYRAEVEAFAQAVIDDAGPPVSGDDGLWSQKVLTACYESAKSGQTVTVG